jgi:4a-hydroxytetrahydrobiopterin dehydratase
MAVLTQNEIEMRLVERTGWSIADGQLRRTFSAPSFHRAMALAVQAGMLADVADHHPDIDIRYNKVTFALSTHSEGGITQQDFDLAAKIDEAFTQ